ncbi:MAG: DUF4349 domain-containing protein [Patescibacteria group bacterium]|nr:DUF4349 domain-containing protein [Patescibacteria group bacterium]
MKKPFKITLIVALIIVALLILTAYLLTLNPSQFNMQGKMGHVVSSDAGEGVAFFGTNEEGTVSREMAVTDSLKMPAAAPIATESAAPADLIATENRVIKTGDIQAKVESAADSTARITQIAAAHKGFVQSSYIYESPKGAKSGNVVIRVPAAEFEVAFQEIKDGVKMVISENVSGQDVTQEYVDLKARLTSKQAEEAQYLEILDKAYTVEDILLVTERLGWVRQEIEQLQGQMKYLENLTDLSTISVFVTEAEKIELPVEKWQPLETIRLAFRAMIASLQRIADAAIWLLFFLVLIVLPIAIVVKLIVMVVKKLRRKKSKK